MLVHFFTRIAIVTAASSPILHKEYPMEMILNDTETRVLGCLIEKEMTTPEYYPLSLNSLTTACNQKSNRDPVMGLDEASVAAALDSLRFKQLAVVAADGGRVVKYRHLLAEKLGLLPPELALVGELMLRGPQTLGELRTRAERMHHFPDLAGVEAVLRELMERGEPLVTRLARQAGRKEARYAHLFGPDINSGSDEKTPAEERPCGVMTAEGDRISRLEDEVASLREEVAALRRVVEEFKGEFE
jgi:uncharacterized protein YceH (UPF0502 family)